jgi:hypothetical protein
MARAKVSLPSKILLTPEEEALRIDVFWEALRIYSISSIVRAFERAYKSFKWFPSPGDIIELIELNPTIEERDKIDWMGPDEQGKQLARKFFKDLYDMLDEKTRSKEKERAEKFEHKRKELRGQARMISKNKDFKKLAAGNNE